MSDTQRSWTEMDALLSTSASNVITAQTVRDGFYSLYNREAVYALLYIPTATYSEQALTSAYAPLTFGGAWLNAASSNTTVTTNGVVTVEQAGVYEVSFKGMGSSASSAATNTFAIAVNVSYVDTTLPSSKACLQNGATFAEAFVTLEAGDTVTLIAKNTGADETLSALPFIFKVRRIA